MSNFIFQPVDDQLTMVAHLNRSKKTVPRFAFCCEECGIIKRSSVGFLRHRQFCGKSDVVRKMDIIF